MKKKFPKVFVQGGDYRYAGWLVDTFEKRSGAIRVVVEDATGRLFIHNQTQIEMAEDETEN